VSSVIESSIDADLRKLVCDVNRSFWAARAARAAAALARNSARAPAIRAGGLGAMALSRIQLM
jgi:hypothetical protein